MAKTDQKKDIGIRKVYNPSDEVKDQIRFVYDRYRAMKDSPDRQQAEKQWDKGEKAWEAYREPKGQDDWQSNHTVPLTLSVVETALSEIVKQNLRPFVRGRGLEDDMKGRIMQHVYDYAWEVSDGDTENYNAIKDMLMMGTAISQEYYRVEKRKVGSVTQKDGKSEPETEYKEVVDYDDVATEIVKLTEFFIDEFARSFTGPYAARDCIRRYIMDIDDFHRMYDDSVWDQFGDAKLVKPGGDTTYYEFYKPPQGINTSKQVEVLHYWNKPLDKFIIVANDVLIRDNPNPYKHKELPFARAVDVKRVHSFYGKGEPEILESIQDEANTLRRMIIDRNHLDIDKMFFVSNKMGLSDEDLMARPHGMIPTDDVNGAKAVEYGDIPRSVELSLQHLEDDGTISTGINPRAQALPTAGTATEAAILKESTLRRIETKIWLFKKEYLTRIGKLRLSNILQFYPQPKLEKIVGDVESQQYQAYIAKLKASGNLVESNNQMFEKSYRQIGVMNRKIDFNAEGKLMESPAQGMTFFELKPDYYIPLGRAGYDIRFDAGANIEISKPLMQEKNLQLFDRFMQIALQVPNSYDIVKLGDMILRDYDKNPDELKPDAPAQDEDQQRLQLSIRLASYENQQMMKGIDVPATAFASTAHTQIHIAFMESPTFQQLPNDSKVIQIFIHHVTGELMAQEARSQQGVGGPQDPNAQPGQPPLPPGQGGTTPTSISQGMQNKPGGMSAPSTSLGAVMPAMNNGSNGAAA